MIPEDASEAIRKPRRPRKSSRKPGLKPKIKRPTLEPNRIYIFSEAALACGCSRSTIVRARDSGNLQDLRVGGKVIFSGEALLAWLNAGGKTS